MTNKEKYISSFSGVEPSDEIKERILNMTKPKKAPFKTAVAVFAIICVLATSASALSMPKLKEFTSRWFPENDILTQDLHSEKNITFNDDCDELNVTCTGILGDKNSILIALDIVSEDTADFEFDESEMYFFNTCSVTFSDGTIGSVLSDVTFSYVNYNTLHSELFVVKTGSQISAGSENVSIRFDDFGHTSEANELKKICSGKFSADIEIDYADSTELLSPCSTNQIKGVNYSIDSNGFVAADKKTAVNLVPVNANISNISFGCNFKSLDCNMNDFELLFGDLSKDDLFFEYIKISLSDGTNIIYSTSSDQNDQCVLNAISCKNNTLSISGRFVKAIDASLIKSVEIDGITVFAK